jgi:predicted trehalose synthase
LWVANHVSDSVSIVDIEPASQTFFQIVHTIQDIDPKTQATRFDEPVGIVFASNQKAYVSLSSENQIAVIDTTSREITKRLRIPAQDPRGMAVRDGRLYVIPFESNNQTQLSGGKKEDIDGDLVTFDAWDHSIQNNNVVSIGHVVDIVKNPKVPDRDLFVFDIESDRLLETVSSLGTLQYGIAVNSQGRVFVAQTDARNDVNGRAGTKKHGLAELGNRPFLNRITTVEWTKGTESVVTSKPSVAWMELEPLPPEDPTHQTAQATPFAVEVSLDDRFLYLTAAGSDSFSIIEASSGKLLGRCAVGAVPQGVSIEYRDNEGKTTVFGLLQEKVENQGDSWVMTIDSVGRFYERVIAKAKKEKLPKLINRDAIKFEEAPELIQEFIGRGFYERVVRLGQRTAEMHLALASDSVTPAFSPEYFTANYQRSLYSTLRKLLRDRFKLLEQTMPKLDPETQKLGKEVLEMEDTILECFSLIYQTRINAIKTRIHGDYHLGQVLFTGKDFIIIDFEGEPGFSFSERRLKKSPLKDVAGMMRSFHYAAFGKILLNENYREKDIEFLEQWAEQWQHYVSRFYLGAYLEKMGMEKSLSPEGEVLIRTYLLEKAVYELGYELNGRPDWVNIPLRGIRYQMRRYMEAKELNKKKK